MDDLYIKKQYALLRISDLIVDYLYYDRKDDEQLSVSAMEELIKSGTLTATEIIDEFTSELKASLKRNFNIQT